MQRQACIAATPQVPSSGMWKRALAKASGLAAPPLPSSAFALDLREPASPLQVITCRLPSCTHSAVKYANHADNLRRSTSQWRNRPAVYFSGCHHTECCQARTAATMNTGSNRFCLQRPVSQLPLQAETSMLAAGGWSWG